MVTAINAVVCTVLIQIVSRYSDFSGVDRGR